MAVSRRWEMAREFAYAETGKKGRRRRFSIAPL